jgi:hypothetical protein
MHPPTLRTRPPAAGSHDSGTYRWTTPVHMPAVLDVVLGILFRIVGDLSRTQRLSVYE